MYTKIEKTHEFVKSYLYAANMSTTEIDYRYEHSLRVANIGRQLALLEASDEKVVVLACLLHDVGRFDTTCTTEHGMISSAIARRFLQTLELEQPEVEHICYAIETHTDKSSQKKYRDTIEAKILRDANTIDRFGATRTKLRFISEHEQTPQSLDTKISTTENLLKTYKNLQASTALETTAGNEWFKNNIETQISFYSSYLDELRLTVKP